VESERWTRLAEAGAREQRLLWASTNTKDPNYPALMYVEPLVGPHTINTMNLETIEAFKSRGSGMAVTIDEGADEAQAVMAELAELGIDIGQVSQQLENDGVLQFIEHYDASLRHLDQTLRAGGQGRIRDRQEPTAGSLLG
jgi:transaldolase